MHLFRKKNQTNKFPLRHLVKHHTKRDVLLKFFILILILVAYGFFVSWKYGLKDGGIITLLTWSFFVLCTPIADAGFLLDFPLRLLFGIRMKISEIIVWSIAISINIIAINANSQVYDHVLITTLLKKILLHPYPYWAIILLSAVGTFLSVVFGDELLDLAHHKERVLHQKHGFKLELIIMVFVFIFALLVYGFLLEHLGISIPA